MRHRDNASEGRKHRSTQNRVRGVAKANRTCSCGAAYSEYKEAFVSTLLGAVRIESESAIASARNSRKATS